MPNNQLIRDHGSIPFEAGTTKSIDLSKSHFYERLNLLASYEVESDGTDGKSGNGILDLIEDITVEFNGSNTLKSTSLSLSHFIDWYQYGTRPAFDPVDHTQDDVTNGTTQSGQLQTFVDFLIHPGKYGALLPSYAFSDLTLEVKWGTASDVGSDIATIVDASIDVQSKERKKQTVVPKGVSQADVAKKLQGFKEREVRKPLNVEGETEIDLTIGNVYYGIPFQVLDGDAPSNDLVSNVTVEEDGVETHRQTTFDLLRASDQQQYGVESQPTGFAYVNYGIHGDTDDVVASRGMDSFKLKVDTDGVAPTAPAEVRMVTQEIVTND